MNDTEKNGINEVNNTFIKDNHEKIALKFAYKKLRTEINKKLLESNRKIFRNRYINTALLLGRKHCALIFRVMNKSLDNDNPIDIENFNPFDIKNSEFKLWGMTIWISKEDDYKIEIIASLGSLDIGADFILEKDFDEDSKPLVDMEKLIDDLPDSMKIKKI